MKYEVLVRETYQKIITIEADSKREAGEIINDMDIIMDPKDYVQDSYHIVRIKFLKEKQ